ncbi:hypothetical protein E2562_030609 [Oryza meyeriana var. granulata]|uniref:Uncharacterized protein n=1 Tax=Oryza meyeriana var. granulata TaxID=110450 RepID=A0A6G1CJR0_9ORYZ|nr:hypothetical protein E2562_030609 [Oryza meyeriana var. granulata]
MGQKAWSFTQWSKAGVEASTACSRRSVGYCNTWRWQVTVQRLACARGLSRPTRRDGAKTARTMATTGQSCKDAHVGGCAGRVAFVLVGTTGKSQRGERSTAQPAGC